VTPALQALAAALTLKTGEEALYEIAPLRQFAKLTLARAIPDETTHACPSGGGRIQRVHQPGLPPESSTGWRGSFRRHVGICIAITVYLRRTPPCGRKWRRWQGR